MIAQQLTAGIHVKVLTASTPTGAINMASNTRVDVLIFGSALDEHDKRLLERELRSLHPAASLLSLD